MGKRQHGGGQGHQNSGGGQKGGRPFMEFFVQGSREQIMLTIKLVFNNKAPTYVKFVIFWLGTESNPYQELLQIPNDPTQPYTLELGPGRPLVGSEALNLTTYKAEYDRITTDCEGIQPVWKPLPPSKPDFPLSTSKTAVSFHVDADVDEDAERKFQIRVHTKKDGKPASRNVFVSCRQNITMESADKSVTVEELGPKRKYGFKTDRKGNAVLVVSFEGIKAHPQFSCPDLAEQPITIDLVKRSSTS